MARKIFGKKPTAAFAIIKAESHCSDNDKDHGAKRTHSIG